MMRDMMAEEKETKKEVQQAFAQKIAQQGYGYYVEAVHSEDLGNSDTAYPAYGFITAAGSKPVVVMLPVSEWLLLAEAIRRKHGEKK